MNHQKIASVFTFAFMILSVILLAKVSSEITGISKEYNSRDLEVTITKDAGLGAEVAKIKLVDYTPYCFPGNCYMFMNLDAKESNYQSLRNVNFYSANRITVDKSKVYEIFDPNLEYIREYNIFNCTVKNDEDKDKFINDKGCYYKEVQTLKGAWTTYDPSTKLPMGVYDMRIKVDLSPGESIDVVPNLYGMDINEWVVFTGMNRYENYTTNDDNGAWIFSPGNVVFQSFTVGSSGANVTQIAKGIAVKLQDIGGAPHCDSTITEARIFSATNLTNCSNYTAAMLGRGINTTNLSFIDGWLNISLSQNATLVKGGAYCLQINTSCTTVNSLLWKEDRTSPTYDDGQAFDQANKWKDYDTMFEIWGVSKNLNVTLISPSSGTTSTSNVTFNSTFSYSGDDSFVNGTLYLWNSTNDVVNLTSYTVSFATYGSFNVTVRDLPFEDYKWNVLACLSTNECVFAPSNNTLAIGLSGINSQTYNSTTYETENETFILNATYDSSSYTVAGTLYYDGTAYEGTKTGSGNEAIFTKTLDIATISSTENNTFYWTMALTNSTGTTYQNSTLLNQTVYNITFQNCTIGTKFFNITFKNETVAKEKTSASITESTFIYYLGSGATNETYSFSSSDVVPEYDFCFNVNRTLLVDARIAYINSESEQRVYNPARLNLTNVTTNTTLWVLPTSSGIYITFQVTNRADQLVSGATVSVSRSGYGTIATETTGASGTVAIFLNPNYQYTLTVTKDGFDTYTTTQAFTASEYTIRLGSTSISVGDYTQGVAIDIYPQIGQVLTNRTDYTFNMTISSSVWTVTSYGFDLTNRSGTNLGSVSSSTVPGTVQTTINTGNLTYIKMNYWWVINSTYMNGTIQYTVSDLSGGSIKGFFSRLNNYLNQGSLFGLTTFGYYILVFAILFVLLGMMTYQLGISDPSVLAIMMCVGIILINSIGIINTPTLAALAGVAIILLIIKEATSE